MTEAATVQEERRAFTFKGKTYRIDGYMKSNLNLIAERAEVGWDNLILIDGPERSGKTTKGFTCAAYLAQRLGREFTHENIFFNIDDIIEYAQKNRKKIILWDEAALGGMAQQWATSEQLKLKQLMITCGKYGHVLIFIIPAFTILGWYFAVHRSICLIRITTPDNITRGDFKFFNIDQKRSLYEQEKKGVWTSVSPSFFGKFSRNDGIIDIEKYEAAKDAAIQRIGQENNKPNNKDYRQKLYVLIDDLHRESRTPYKYFSELLGMPLSVIKQGISYFRNKGILPAFEYKDNQEKEEAEA